MTTSKTSKPTRTLRSQHTYVSLDKHIEHPKGASVTVPDDAFTIEEILRRSQQGIAPDVYHDGEYHLDDKSEDFDQYDIEKLKLLDPYDREMLARDLKAKNLEHQKILEEFEAQKRSHQEIENQKQEDARIAAFLERQAKKSKPDSNDAKGGTTGS